MITLETQRVLWNRQGTLADYTPILNDYQGSSLVFDYTVGDYLYIGTWYPFNHRHFEINVANTSQANITIEYWNGQAWEQAVDIIDFTSDLGVSNSIRWVTDDDEQTWNIEEDTSEDIPELSSVRIYDKYWLRISWDANLDATTELLHVGFKYSDDVDLYSRYPDLNNQQFRDNYLPDQPRGTKLDWNEQHFIGSNEVIKEMKRRRIIKSQDMILDFELLRDAAVHKVAELIYATLGEAYIESRKTAREYFQEALNTSLQPIDKNQNARMDAGELVNMSGKMSR